MNETRRSFDSMYETCPILDLYECELIEKIEKLEINEDHEDQIKNDIKEMIQDIKDNITNPFRYSLTDAFRQVCELEINVENLEFERDEKSSVIDNLNDEISDLKDEISDLEDENSNLKSEISDLTN